MYIYIYIHSYISVMCIYIYIKMQSVTHIFHIDTLKSLKLSLSLLWSPLAFLEDRSRRRQNKNCCSCCDVIESWIWLVYGYGYSMDILLVHLWILYEYSNLPGGFPGTWLAYFPIWLGNVNIPMDFHIFQRGWNHQAVYVMNHLGVCVETCCYQC